MSERERDLAAETEGRWEPKRPVPPGLRQKLLQLPAQAGVYLMKDAQGRVIYVGKAASLKSRVRSYFQSPHLLTPKTAALVEKIADLETIVVDNPRQALILESNLIKEHRPHYNILLRDDKHYPYLRLTASEDFPRLVVARRAKNDGDRYFGPYVSSKAMNQAVHLIQKLFPLRSCRSKTWPVNHRACLNSHIGLCLAPCAGRISREEYGAMVEQVALFLQGKTKEISRQVERAMEKASEELRFEEAARLRDLLQALDQVQEQQQLDRSSRGENFHVLACAIGEDLGVMQIFFVRGGKVVGREHFFLTNLVAGEESQLTARFLWEYYGAGDQIPGQIFLNHLPPAEEREELEALLGESAGHKVSLSVPQRGDKRRLLHLVENNAQLVLEQQLQSRDRQERQAAEALEDLRQALGLERAPARMECYDISHFQGSYTVGSMVVFQNGRPAPKLYRHFRIKTVAGVNDFASLQEVLRRRWQRGLREREAGKEPLDFGVFPDLLVIDGGKGQLSAVCETLAEIGAGKVDIISLAKEEEEVFRPGESRSLRLPHDTPALQLLQRLRDEAHRFAITYHRQLRKKGQVASVLDAAPGIGATRRKNLLKAFGSLKHIQAATVEELAHAPGMNEKVAAQLYDFLHEGEERDG